MNNKAIGALVGLAVGDAVGTTVEFKDRTEFTPLTDMVGGGPFRLNVGEWTDDTSMALCLGYSLLEKGFDPVDQMNRYVKWYTEGYMSCNGRCFDIGGTTRGSLRRFMETGDPFVGTTDSLFGSGNGALMRIAPVAILYHRVDKAKLLSYALDSTRVTHATPECKDASMYFIHLLADAITGATKEDLKKVKFVVQSYTIAEIMVGEYISRSRDYIRGSGYVVESLEAALWCFYNTENFRDAILMAANLGDDADTTAAICGQIAGAYYGIEGIPLDWIKKLAWNDKIIKLAGDLYEKSLH